MKRAIKAHKGGRTIKKSLDVTPDTASTLANLPISLGDLVEVAAKDMKMNQEQLNTLIGKQYPFRVWNDELEQEVGEYMEVGSAELSIRQPSGKPYARLAAVGVTWEMGKAGTAYIPLEQAMKYAETEVKWTVISQRWDEGGDEDFRQVFERCGRDDGGWVYPPDTRTEEEKDFDYLMRRGDESATTKGGRYRYTGGDAFGGLETIEWKAEPLKTVSFTSFGTQGNSITLTPESAALLRSVGIQVTTRQDGYECATLTDSAPQEWNKETPYTESPFPTEEYPDRRVGHWVMFPVQWLKKDGNHVRT